MKPYHPKTTAIVGFGRFGQLLAVMLSSKFDVYVTSRSNKSNIAKKLGVKFVPLKDAFEADAVFYTVPISKLESVVRKTKKYMRPGQVIFDVASVKVYAQNVFKNNLADTDTHLILSHPMFGPDSAQKGFRYLPMVMHNLRASKNIFNFWKKTFSSYGLRVTEMTPEEHDKKAANSQGITHFIGRVLDDLKLEPTDVDTKGFQKLMEVREQTCNDTWELFHDLQTYNPYTKPMRLKLEHSLDRISDKLLPKRVDSRFTTIGIQGGCGSFNEEACLEYCKKIGLKRYKIVYLYTSEKVLRCLHCGDIDIGQFAIQNAIGGMVQESVEALSKYQCTIHRQFEFLVSHCLLIKPGVKKEDIRTIMSHPQALAQCTSTLAKKYPHLKLVSGKGSLVDQAHAAEHLAKGKLPKTTAILAPKVCADLFNLEIVDRNLQDMKKNFTTFLWVKRPSR